MDGIVRNAFVVSCHTICLVLNFFENFAKICEYFVFHVQECGPFFEVEGPFISRSVFSIVERRVDELED